MYDYNWSVGVRSQNNIWKNEWNNIKIKINWNSIVFLYKIN